MDYEVGLKAPVRGDELSGGVTLHGAEDSHQSTDRDEAAAFSNGHGVQSKHKTS